jgi:hypothetical protein
MESLSGFDSINHSESEKNPISEKKGSISSIKVISLIFGGLAGLAACGLFGGIFYSLADPVYYALLFRTRVLGYICVGFALINIAINLIFKKYMFLFLPFSFLTIIFGASQMTIFAFSPFGIADKINNGLLTHYQYVLSFGLSLIALVFVCLYIINSRKKGSKIKSLMH